MVQRATTDQVIAASTTAPPSTGLADRTTRYLAAATHLDTRFAGRVLSEFLSEPRRALSLSAGVNVAAVLHHAVAAEARRKIRDWILLGIAAPLVLISPLHFASWLIVALATQEFTGERTMLGQVGPQPSRSRRRWASIAIVLAIFISFAISIVEFVLFTALAKLSMTLSELANSEPDNSLRILSIVQLLSTVLPVFVFAVLVSDRYAEWSFATRTFARFPNARNRWPGESWLTRLGTARHMQTIRDIARTQANGNTLVFRGPRPFVGFGEVIDHASFAIPLIPTEQIIGPRAERVGALPRRSNDAAAASFSPTDVYRHVYSEFDKLRSSNSLSPSQRLRLTNAGHFIAVASEGLLENYNDPRSNWILRDPNLRPVSDLPTHLALETADHPVEWMRYYLRFTVESWDRELAVSAFLHIGCDERMIYVEWTCCALLPLLDGYRRVDELPFENWRPLRLALTDLIMFPATLANRMRSAFRRIGQRQDRRFVWPSTYGTNGSIRELATAAETRSYFEEADVERYMEILRRHTLGSIADFLDLRGMSSREFSNRVMNYIDNSTNNFGNNNGAMQGGTVNFSSKQSNSS